MLGVNWPSVWECDEWSKGTVCGNDYWNPCIGNDGEGKVICSHNGDDGYFAISMYQPDDSEDFHGMTTCDFGGQEFSKVCKALGGKLIVGGDEWGIYQLN